MSYLVDTNVLLRWLLLNDPRHSVAVAAVDNLVACDEELFVCPQNIIELWNVATRPLERNGFGLTPARADHEAQKVEDVFPMLEDSPDIYKEWRKLVVAAGVSGVQVHDARLAAVMHVHGITHLLTFNPRDFSRYSVTVVVPEDVPPMERGEAVLP